MKLHNSITIELKVVLSTAYSYKNLNGKASSYLGERRKKELPIWGTLFYFLSWRDTQNVKTQAVQRNSDDQNWIYDYTIVYP